MKSTLKRLWVGGCIFSALLQLHAQGYIVPNGVYMGSFMTNEIDVCRGKIKSEQSCPSKSGRIVATKADFCSGQAVCARVELGNGISWPRPVAG